MISTNIKNNLIRGTVIILVKTDVSYKLYSLLDNIKNTILIYTTIVKKNIFFSSIILYFEEGSGYKFISNIIDNSKITKIWF